MALASAILKEDISDPLDDPLDCGSIPAGASRAHVLVLRLKRWLDADINRILTTYSDLSLPEWRILSVLSRCEGVMSQKDVVRQIVITQGQASRALFSLQSGGLVEASQSRADRRSWNYRLSEKGRAQFNVLLPHMNERKGALDGAVGLEELAQFEQTATKIARAAQGRLDEN